MIRKKKLKILELNIYYHLPNIYSVKWKHFAKYVNNNSSFFPIEYSAYKLQKFKEKNYNALIIIYSHTRRIFFLFFTFLFRTEFTPKSSA